MHRRAVSPHLRMTFARLCRETRNSLDVTQERLAVAVGVTRSYIGQIERGTANPSLGLVSAIGDALGIELDLIGRAPVIVGPPGPRDALHARCSAYADRRLRGHGMIVQREVEIVDGRWRGWIDLLAFDPRRGLLIVVEIKTRIDDIGAHRAAAGLV